jgi:ring-1,2-phenylacetyl-CoA epoxidase subunit PaaE
LQTQFRYQCGQFVSFFMEFGTETISRSYSLSTSPMVDKEFKITVKKVAGGRGSTFLCEKVREGDTLLTAPPAGQFFKPFSSENGVHFLLFAAGSGITPVFSILKTVLATDPANHVTLIYCNRDEKNIIYRNELDRLCTQYGPRLEVIHTLTRAGTEWKGRRGRVTSELTSSVLQKARASGRAVDSYLCGPSDFMSALRLDLKNGGLDSDRIHIEDFGGAIHKPAGPKVDASWTFIGPDNVNETPEKIIAQINGETVEVNAVAGQSVLETLLQAGAQPPYSCMDGACMACMGKIQSGRVYQEDPGILSEDNVKHCEALTCQAKPLSRIVKVSFDNL